MKKKFNVIFLEEATDFISSLESKIKNKIIYNIDKASYGLDPKIFKKLSDTIWEFRIKYGGIQYRLFAFWDKSNTTKTIVVSTHGMIKKVSKVPKNELEKADQIRKKYLNIT